LRFGVACLFCESSWAIGFPTASGIDPYWDF
jgi:hypothetical protein